MRKIFNHALIILLILLLSSCAYADAVLYRGAKNIGAVQTSETSLGYCVPVEDVAKLLGFSSSRSGEELLLKNGSSTLKVITNSAAAWHGISIIPLYSAPFESNGKIWLDALSAASLFQSSAGLGQANKLRFNKILGESIQNVIARSDIEFGKVNDPEPKYTASQVNTVPISSKVNASSAASQAIAALAIGTLKTSQTSTTQNNEFQAISQVNAVQAAAINASGKSQPKIETFRPETKKKVKAQNYSGTVKSVNWSVQDGAQKKIRAVFETDENADPQVFMSGGNLHALFSSCNVNIESPYSNITVEAKSSAKGIEIIFTPKGITKAEKFVLSNPRRIAFTFTFPANTKIADVQPKVSTPSQNARPPAPAVTVPTNTSTTRPDPIITTTPRRQSPAVTTLPSTITIPTSPSAASRLKRKTIVIDPGHGGKDPGAAANGVTEKNVNLGIGLELEKVLASKGYNVIMTRRNDVYLKLQERTDIANNANADLFVSVHVNALPSKKSMTGFEIYIMALPTDKDAMNLAKIENREYVEGKGMDTANVDRRTEMLLKILGDMQQNNKISESTDFAAALYNAGSRNGLPMRRVAQAPFFVLRGAGMPAVLLETGFVTNATEAAKLTTSAYQQKIAQAMAEGIISYLK